METENGAWSSLAESIPAPRSAFTLIMLPGKEGKAPAPPSFCLFPAASSGQDEFNPQQVPGCSCPLLPLALPSSSPLLHLPRDAWQAELPPKAVSRCGRQDWELCWCCPWAGPSRAASVTGACLQNKELLHRHSGTVCVVSKEKTLAQTSEHRNLLMTEQIKAGKTQTKPTQDRCEGSEAEESY